MKPGEKLIIGLRSSQDLEELSSLYNTAENEMFAKQVLARCNVSANNVAFSVEANKAENQVDIWLKFKKETPVTFKGFSKVYKPNEGIRIGVSHSLSPEEIDSLLSEKELGTIDRFENKEKDYQIIVAKRT
jgi:uncharacterized SAM-dependent methyltransferase